MLRNRITAATIISSLIFFSVFVYVHEKRAYKEIQSQIQQHAMIIADDLWNFNYQGAEEYLQLAAVSNSYETLVVTDHSGQVFASIRMPHIGAFKQLLVRLRLIPRVKLMAHVKHQNRIIGWIEAIWISDTLFFQAYVFFVLVMVVFVVYLYLRVLEEKQKLEGRVDKRTNELTKMNQSLKQEISERIRIESALRESEEKHRLLAENINDVIWTMDMDQRLTYISPVAEKMHGWRIEEIPSNLKLEDVLTPESYQHAMRNFRRFLKIGEETGSFDQSAIMELELYKKGGQTIWTEVTASFIMGLTGKPEGVLGVSRDITERLKAQQEKNELEQKLVRSKKMESLGLLAGGVAHDLNNVLSGIVSYPDLILMDLPENSPIRGSVLTIQQSGRKAASIVQDLLTLARRGVITDEPVNFNDLVSEHLESPEYKKLLSFHPNILVESKLEPRLPNIKGSPIHLKKTIMNLLSNAAEAQPCGGKIMVSTDSRYLDKPVKGYETVKEGEYVVFTVEDQGEGIEELDLHRIFEPFYTKKVMGRSGTGLGMAVVWGTVQDHDGYIDIQSHVGKGTTFELFFPMSREQIVDADKVISINELKGNGETVLVVDDIAEQREVASKILGVLNYSVQTAAGGEEALSVLKHENVDLVVLDMIMEPGIDGLETYKRILEIHPDQKAIITSGFAETDRAREALKLGAGEYVKKPYMIEQIGKVIKKELARA